MRFFAYFFLGLTVAGVAALVVNGHRTEGLSFLLGAALMLMNVALFGVIWKRLLAKKSIALSSGVIVIKYATLGFIIYQIARPANQQVLSVGWFMVGIGVVLPAAVVTAIRTGLKPKSFGIEDQPDGELNDERNNEPSHELEGKPENESEPKADEQGKIET